jgi:hypothetical protein
VLTRKRRRPYYAHCQAGKFGAVSLLSLCLMSIKVSTAVWQGSRNKSGNLLVLLALADHANDQGFAWPRVPLLAREARLSQRHTRRCLNELAASGELEILPTQAPSGKALYRIRLEQLHPDNLSTGTSASDSVTPVSVSADASDRPLASPYIEEPSIKPSKEPNSKVERKISNPNNPPGKKHARSPDAIGLVSSPKSGF